MIYFFSEYWLILLVIFILFLLIVLGYQMAKENKKNDYSSQDINDDPLDKAIEASLENQKIENIVEKEDSKEKSKEENFPDVIETKEIIDVKNDDKLDNKVEEEHQDDVSDITTNHEYENYGLSEDVINNINDIDEQYRKVMKKRVSFDESVVDSIKHMKLKDIKKEYNSDKFSEIELPEIKIK